jgi:hypothetical protein
VKGFLVFCHTNYDAGVTNFHSLQTEQWLHAERTYGLDDWSDIQAAAGRNSASIGIYRDFMDGLAEELAGQVAAWANLESTTPYELTTAWGALGMSQNEKHKTAKKVKKVGEGAETGSEVIPGPIGEWLGKIGTLVSVLSDIAEEDYQAYMTELAQAAIENACKRKTGNPACEERKAPTPVQSDFSPPPTLQTK